VNVQPWSAAAVINVSATDDSGDDDVDDDEMQLFN